MELARVLSLVVTILLLEPLLAPMFGQVVLMFGSWRSIAATVVAAGAALLLWTMLRLDETLPAAARRSVSRASLAAACRVVLANRPAVISMLVLGLVSGAHLGFLTSSQGIFQQTFGAGLRYTLLLALVSGAMSIAALINVRLVRRHGSRALIGCCLQGMVLVNALALGASMAGAIDLPLFMAIQSCNMFAFGLLLPNLTAMAMDPFGQIAGTASSLYGFLVATVGALLAFAVGQFFDGTVRPMLAAYAILSAVALLLIAWARGAPVRQCPDLEIH
jgi:DHA1 family bicyclomycin/chloramphenicol resistance-like MFS transporter